MIQSLFLPEKGAGQGAHFTTYLQLSQSHNYKKTKITHISTIIVSQK